MNPKVSRIMACHAGFKDFGAIMFPNFGAQVGFRRAPIDFCQPTFTARDFISDPKPQTLHEARNLWTPDPEHLIPNCKSYSALGYREGLGSLTQEGP